MERGTDSAYLGQPQQQPDSQRGQVRVVPMEEVLGQRQQWPQLVPTRRLAGQQPLQQARLLLLHRGRAAQHQQPGAMTHRVM